MKRTTKFGELTFDEAFLTATEDDGKQITFTKAETSLLKHFSQHPMLLRSRSQLLDAVSAGNEEKLDRSIDFLINRLRRKLGDNAKTPTFIATRYGEGYIWLATKAKSQTAPNNTHAVVGPLFGLDHIGAKRTSGLAFAKQFHENFQGHFNNNLQVAFHPEPEHKVERASTAAKIGVELSFVIVDEQLECVFRGYQYQSDATIFAKRISVSQTSQPNVKSIANEISGLLRTSLATQCEEQVPLTVGMIEAGKTFTGIKGHWSEGDQNLRKRVEDYPADYRAKIMLATNIHTKYLQDSVKIFMSNDDPREKDENEIEELITQSLPNIQNEPSFLLPCAKLLYFIDRGYNEMAVRMTERLHKESTSLSASLPVVGQIRVFEGQNTDGQRALDQALELCAPGSQFEIYLLILKCEAMVAVSDRDGLDQILNKVCTQVPQIEVLMQILFTCAQHPSKIAQQALVNMPPAQAKGMMMLMHYVYGRLYKMPSHIANAYRTPISLFSKQFGVSIIPQEVAQFVKLNNDRVEENFKVQEVA